MAIDTLTQKIVLDERGYVDGMKTVERVTRETTAKVRAEFRRTRTAAQQIGVSSGDVNKTANAISQLGSAAGGAAGEVGTLVSQVSAGFLTGGAIGAGVAVATLAISKITEATREARQESERLAREAEQKLAAAMEESKRRVDAANQSLKEQRERLIDIRRALAEGVDLSALIDRRTMVEAEDASREAERRLRILQRQREGVERLLEVAQARADRLRRDIEREAQQSFIGFVSPFAVADLRKADRSVKELTSSLEKLDRQLEAATPAAEAAASELEALITGRTVRVEELRLAEERRHKERMESLRVERRAIDLIAAGEDASVARIRAEIEALKRREGELRKQLATNSKNLKLQRELEEVLNRQTEASRQLANVRASARQTEAARKQAEEERKATAEAERRAAIERELSLATEALRIRRERGVSAARAAALAEIKLLEEQIEKAEDLNEELRLTEELQTRRIRLQLEDEADALSKQQARQDQLAKTLETERKRTADMIRARDQLTEATNRGIPVEQVRAEHALRAAQVERDRILAMEDSAEKADLLAIALNRVAQAELQLQASTPRVITDTERMRDAFLEAGAAIRDAFASAIGSAVGDLATFSVHTLAIEEATRRATEAQLAFGDAADRTAAASQNAASYAIAAVAAQTQAVLAGIAEEATAKALFQVAEGIWKTASGNPVLMAQAAGHFAAAKAFGAVGGGAALLGAGIGAARGRTREEQAQIDRADGDRMRAEHDRRAGEDRDGGLTVVVQTSQVYGTETDVNRAVREGVETAGWYD